MALWDLSVLALPSPSITFLFYFIVFFNLNLLPLPKNSGTMSSMPDEFDYKSDEFSVFDRG